MTKGLVSTIIPVFNRPKMLSEAVLSVLGQTYRPIEIFIVDDGSTDKTRDLAKELDAYHSEVTTLSIKNSGPGPAREVGRQHASGEFIQYLDSDDLLHPEKFALQVASLRQLPDCGISYCRQQYCEIDGRVIDPAWMRSDEIHKTMFPAMLAGRLWGTAVPLYRHSLLKKCGPWLDLRNEEDWEYDCRIASTDVQLSYVNETLVTIRTHDDGHYGEYAKDLSKLKDRVRAYTIIYQHAINANILCRQSGAHGLSNESKQLLELLLNFKGSSFFQWLEYRLFYLGARMFGTKALGKLSAHIDGFRK